MGMSSVCIRKVMSDSCINIWGNGFKELNQCRMVEGVEFDEKHAILTILLHGGESIRAWNPDGFRMNANEVTMEEATRIRWQREDCIGVIHCFECIRAGDTMIVVSYGSNFGNEFKKGTYRVESGTALAFKCSYAR